jgi:hypothetical protein
MGITQQSRPVACTKAFTLDADTEVHAYLDLATLYRNLVKELAALGELGVLQVMVKGTDWMPGSVLVDCVSVA